MADVPIQIHFCAGDLMSDHGDLGAGEFCLIRGADQLIVPARITAHDGTERQADQVNCLTFLSPAGQIQRQWSDRKAFYVTPPTDNAQFFTCEAELSDCYRHPNEGSPVTSYRRAILWQKPDVLIVYDRVVKKNALTKARWHINAPLSATPSMMRWDVGESSLEWSVVLPVASQMLRVPQMLGTPLAGTTTKTLSSYDLQVQEAGGTLSVEFLNVFQALPKGGVPKPVTRTGNIISVGGVAVWVLPAQ